MNLWTDLLVKVLFVLLYLVLESWILFVEYRLEANICCRISRRSIVDKDWFGIL